MLKHIGRHGERKVVVAYNTVPGEDHMALVIYSDNLPSVLHDEVMKVVESAAGQGANRRVNRCIAQSCQQKTCR